MKYEKLVNSISPLLAVLSKRTLKWVNAWRDIHNKGSRYQVIF